MQWTNVFVILFCTEFRSNGRKKTSSHLKYLNPIILKVCLESDRGLIRQILATQPRLGPRPPSLSPQSRGRVSGGDIVDLVLLDTSSVNMKRALFWKRKKSNKRFTNWLQSFHFIKGLDHGTVSIDYTVQCSASSNTRISISISNRNISAAQAHVWHSAVIYPIRVTCQLSAYIICLHRLSLLRLWAAVGDHKSW